MIIERAYYSDGYVQLEIYNNKKFLRHRLDGPAYIHYLHPNILHCEIYYINGKIHRQDGPAEIWYNNDGTVLKQGYWLNSINIEEEEFLKQVEMLKAIEIYS